MLMATCKKIVIGVLRDPPESAALARLRSVSDRQIGRLLLWLDRSGLSLYFLQRLRDLQADGALSPILRTALEQRLETNRSGVEEVIPRFSAINTALARAGVDYLFLKGFTLVPDFCFDPYLRHFSDIDVFVPAHSIEAATEAAQGCGYELIGINELGEVKLSTPQKDLPSRFDPMFAPHSTQMLELHSTLWRVSNVTVPIPGDLLLQHRVPHVFRDIEFPGLDVCRKFLFQLLHAFRHILSCSIRIAWLYELTRFFATPRPPEFWLDCCRSTGPSQAFRNACGVVLALTASLFGVPIPEVLSAQFVQSLPLEVRVWAESIGPRWAMSEPETNKAPLLICRYFMQDPSLWKSLVWHELLPLGRIRNARAATRQMQVTTRDTSYVIWKHRFRTRWSCLFLYPIEYLRFEVDLRRRSSCSASGNGSAPNIIRRSLGDN